MLRSLLLEYQVLHALLLRELQTRFGSHRLGYLWALIEPIIMIGTFAAVWSAFGRGGQLKHDVLSFLATGFIPFILFRETTNRSLYAIDGNKGLLFYTLVRPLDLVVARILLELATQVVVFIVMIAGIAMYRGGLEFHDLLTTMVGLLLASALGGSLGLTLCGLTAFSPSVERIQGPLLRPLFWVSGLFYPATALPLNLKHLSGYNPVLHVVEMVREGWLPGYAAYQTSVSYVLAWILTLTFVGLALERVARRRLQLS